MSFKLADGSDFLLAGVGFALRDKILVAQPLTVHAAHHRDHLVDGVGRSDVVTSGEFVHVAVKVLRAHPVVGADVAALEHGPE